MTYTENDMRLAFMVHGGTDKEFDRWISEKKDQRAFDWHRQREETLRDLQTDDEMYKRMAKKEIFNDLNSLD